MERSAAQPSGNWHGSSIPPIRSASKVRGAGCVDDRQGVCPPDRGRVRAGGCGGIDAAEIRKRTAVDRFCDSCLIAQVVQVLQQIQPQHDLQWIGFVAALSFVIARLNHGKPFLPRDDPLNLGQKLFFFVRTCANSSLNAEIVICLSMLVLYHIRQYLAYFSCAVLP